MVAMKWKKWSKSAFALAKKEKKPILLSIGAVWCHWCHTMDDEVYSDQKVQKFIAKNFVPIRVDTDLRPDVNEKYNAGGWPTTLVLAHDGEPVWGALYVPKDNMIGFLKDGKEAYRKYKPKSKKQRVYSSVPVSDIEEEVFDHVSAYFDPVHGGFGLEPKFLHPDILDFLVWRALVRKDESSLDMLESTLDCMLKSDVFDWVGGGFYRYAADRDWSSPHFEKLLEENARMLVVLLNAYDLLKKDTYLDACNRILFFLLTMLYDPEGKFFYNSQDADEAYCDRAFEGRFSKKPSIDKRVFSGPNSVVVVALLLASKREKEYEVMALECLNSVYRKTVTDKGVLHSTSNKVFLLKDLACMIAACISAFEHTKDRVWRARALKLTKFLGRFEDIKGGGYYSTLKSNSIGRLSDRQKSITDNSLVALILLQLANVTGERDLSFLARRALMGVTEKARMQGVLATNYVLAASTLMKF